MSQPELLDRIRSARIVASPELRARVRAITAATPAAPPPRREVPWRRWTLVLVPACLAVALVGALAVGLATSGKQSTQQARGGAGSTTEVLSSEAQRDTATPVAPPSAKATEGAGLPTTPGRAQLYEAELTLKVKSLSAATKRALRLTRSFNGYVRSVEYGSGTERGSAYLVLRVPIGSVQDAIVRFSALGEILDQHVSIKDVQPQVDRRFRAMQTLRDAIVRLQARLESPTLSADERKALENELVASRRRLLELRREQARLRRQTSFATVSIGLRSTDKAVVVPHDPGRIGRALDRSGSILLDEVKVLVYVLIVGAPLLALAALVLGGSRLRRRRTESRLLSTS
jgi:Domain of unknown function (DUF4349)